MAVRLDKWVRSLCQEALSANTDFVLAQRNTFMSLLKDEYHSFFLNDSSFLNIENMQFSFYLKPVKDHWWQKIWPFSKKGAGLNRFKLCPKSQDGALLCEVNISRSGKLFEEEIKIEGQKADNEQIYVEET